MLLSRKSALFSWAKFGGIKEWQTSTDTCHIIRAIFITAPLKFLLLVALGVIPTAILVVAPFMALLLWINTGVFFDELVVPLLIILAAALIIGVGIGIGALICYIKDRDRPMPKSLELVRNAYEAFDQKYCHVVYLED